MNNKNSSLKLNFLMNAFLTTSSFIFPLITFPYISRVLLPEGTGKVSFATSVVTYFALFAQLGIPTYGIRACAKVRDDKVQLSRTVQEIFTINLGMSVITYCAFFIALFTISRIQEEKALFLIVSSTILFNAIGMEWLYKGLERYTYITATSILFKLIALGATFLLIHQKSDYVIYGGISIFAASASSVCNFVNAHKYILFKPVGGYNFKRHLKPILIFFAMSCATTIYTNLDTVMLGFIKTDADVGYYSAATKIKNVLLGIVTSLGTVLLPRASYYIEHGESERFKQITQKAINFVFLISMPLAVYFTLFAWEGILFLSGKAYENAVLPMQILMPTLVLIGLTNIMGIQVLVPIGREKVVLYSEIAGACVDLVLNALLIPRMASVGAAIGTLAAETAVWAVQFAALKNIILPAYKQVKYTAIAFALSVGTVVSLLAKGIALGNFVTLVISAMLFFGMYAIVLLAMKEPFIVEIARQIFEKLKKSSTSK